MAVQIIDSLRHRRSIVLLSTALAGTALAVAGCGGSSQAGAASPSETASVRARREPVLPRGDDRLQRPPVDAGRFARQALPGIPGAAHADRPGPAARIRSTSTTDVKPLLGERAAIAGLNLAGTKAIRVRSRRPTPLPAPPRRRQRPAGGRRGRARRRQADRHGGAARQVRRHQGRASTTASTSTRTAPTPWSRSPTTRSSWRTRRPSSSRPLDAHQAGGDKTLAGTSKFSDAIGKLPADVFGQAYVDVGAAVQQAGKSSPQLEPARPLRLPERRHGGVDRRRAARAFA